MKKIICSIVMLFCSVALFAQQPSLAVRPESYAKMPILLVYVAGGSAQSAAAHNFDLTTLSQDLEFTRQFAITVDLCLKRPSKKEKKSFFKKGYALVVYVEPDVHSVDWWVEDAMTLKMQGGKKYHKKGTSARGWSHQVADSIWQVLTNQPGFFSTRIAYCKEIVSKKGIRKKQLCIADYNGAHETTLVDLPTIIISPRWNNDPLNPLLFYSEHTNTNVRLMIVNMNKRRYIASNFDGFNMLPAFSQDGQEMVYCRSSKDGYCQLHHYKGNILKQVTNYAANNMSPTMSADGKLIYFCSDLKDGLPHIFSYNLDTKELLQITHKDYAVSPVYCSATNQLAYLRMVQGLMQLFVYDITRNIHTQLTFDGGNKEDCCWSPCGNYLLFAIENKGAQRVVMMNSVSREYFYLTDPRIKCSDPAWSSAYHEFPLVVNA
jgi:TolB protein